jgi:hypothetical protein
MRLGALVLAGLALLAGSGPAGAGQRALECHTRDGLKLEVRYLGDSEPPGPEDPANVAWFVYRHRTFTWLPVAVYLGEDWHWPERGHLVAYVGAVPHPDSIALLAGPWPRMRHQPARGAWLRSSQLLHRPFSWGNPVIVFLGFPYAGWTRADVDSVRWSEGG